MNSVLRLFIISFFQWCQLVLGYQIDEFKLLLYDWKSTSNSRIKYKQRVLGSFGRLGWEEIKSRWNPLEPEDNPPHFYLSEQSNIRSFECLAGRACNLRRLCQFLSIVTFDAMHLCLGTYGSARIATIYNLFIVSFQRSPLVRFLWGFLLIAFSAYNVSSQLIQNSSTFRISKNLFTSRRLKCVWWKMP